MPISKYMTLVYDPPDLSCLCCQLQVAVDRKFRTIAPADTSRMMLLQFAWRSAILDGALNKVRTNDFQTPNAVPKRASLPTRTGMEAMKVMALVLSANELSKIGPNG